MKEICEAFDELQKKKSNDLRDDTDRSDLGCDAPSVDGVEDNGVNVELKDNKGAVGCNGETVKEEGTGDFGSKLERCSQIRGENDTEDVEPSASCGAKESSSPVFSSEEKNEMSSVVHPKVSKTSNSHNSSHSKKQVSDYKHEDDDIRNKKHGEGQRSLVNGYKSKMGSGSKRRCDGTVEVHKGSSSLSLKKDGSVGRVDRPQSGERLRDGTKGKTVSGGNKRKLSPDSHKPETGSRDGKKTKDLLKAKRHVKVLDEPKDSVDDLEDQARDRLSGRTKKTQVGRGKPNLGSNDTLHPSKKSKHVDAGGNTRRGSFSKSPPSSDIVDQKTVKKLDLKMSTSRVKSENNLVSKSQNVNASGDEAVLPLTKRRRRAMEAMSDSDTLVSDEKMEKAPVQKNNVARSSDVKVLAAQTQRKRRAVCLYDDEEEDEKPKTPVHGGSSRNLKAPSNFSDAIKSTDENIESSDTALQSTKHATEVHGSHTKESSSSQLKNGSLSPSKPAVDEKGSERQTQTDEKRLEKAVHVYQSPAKLEPDQQLSKEAKPTLTSPKKSPLLISATKPAVEQQKATKAPVKVSNTATQKKSQAASGNSSRSVSNSLASSQIPKPTARPISRVSDSAILPEDTADYNSLPAERYACF